MASGCNEPIKRRSNCDGSRPGCNAERDVGETPASTEEKKSFSLRGAWTVGSQFWPHCLAASIAICCHFACFCSASFLSRSTIVRSEINGAISAAPISTAFCMIKSMFFPFGILCPTYFKKGGKSVSLLEFAQSHFALRNIDNLPG